MEGSAGGGAVQVVANCHQEIGQVRIDKSVIDPEDPEMLEGASSRPQSTMP